jgi:hypothetical protein
MYHLTWVSLFEHSVRPLAADQPDRWVFKTVLCPPKHSIILWMAACNLPICASTRATSSVCLNVAPRENQSYRSGAKRKFRFYYGVPVKSRDQIISKA